MAVEVAAPLVDQKALVDRILTSPHPLGVSDLCKAFPRPKKTRAADWATSIRLALDQAVTEGKVFAAASGKKNERRYWNRDERRFIQGLLDRLAIAPQPIKKLVAAVRREALGASAQFVEQVIRQSIAAKRLFEHPGSRANTVRYSIVPPPPILRQARHQKRLKSITTQLRKILEETKLPLEELLDELALMLSPSPAANEKPLSGLGAQPTLAERVSSHDELRHLILTAVANTPVASLAQLRSEMPAEYRGPIFDQTVLRLADEGSVILSQDVEPSHLTPEVRAQCVTDGVNVLTTICRGNRP